jgi:hypothetical protein
MILWPFLQTTDDFYTDDFIAILQMTDDILCPFLQMTDDFFADDR